MFTWTGSKWNWTKCASHKIHFHAQCSMLLQFVLYVTMFEKFQWIRKQKKKSQYYPIKMIKTCIWVAKAQGPKYMIKNQMDDKILIIKFQPMAYLWSECHAKYEVNCHLFWEMERSVFISVYFIIIYKSNRINKSNRKFAWWHFFVFRCFGWRMNSAVSINNFE